MKHNLKSSYLLIIKIFKDRMQKCTKHALQVNNRYICMGPQKTFHNGLNYIQSQKPLTLYPNWKLSNDHNIHNEQRNRKGQEGYRNR